MSGPSEREASGTSWTDCSAIPLVGRLHQPHHRETKAQVLGEKFEMATKLVYCSLRYTREKDELLDLHQEVFVSHRGVFLDIGQFAVYVAKFIKPKQRPTADCLWMGQQ